VLQRGANVFMPNITPGKYRRMYQLYPNKPCVDEDGAACAICVRGRLSSLGPEIGTGRDTRSTRTMKRSHPSSSTARSSPSARPARSRSCSESLGVNAKRMAVERNGVDRAPTAFATTPSHRRPHRNHPVRRRRIKSGGHKGRPYCTGEPVYSPLNLTLNAEP
jgi:hypothetical protein